MRLSLAASDFRRRGICKCITPGVALPGFMMPAGFYVNSIVIACVARRPFGGKTTKS